MAYSELLAMHWKALDEEQQHALSLEVAHACQGGTNWNSRFVMLVIKSDVSHLNLLFGIKPDLAAAAHAMTNGLIPYEEWQAIEKEQAEKTRKAAELHAKVSNALVLACLTHVPADFVFDDESEEETSYWDVMEAFPQLPQHTQQRAEKIAMRYDEEHEETCECGRPKHLCLTFEGGDEHGDL